jgi:hypothetical protein
MPQNTSRNPDTQFRFLERFGDIVIGTGIHGLHNVLILGDFAF